MNVVDIVHDAVGSYIAKSGETVLQFPDGTSRNATDVELLTVAKINRRAEVDDERDRRESLGCPYQFPNGLGVVQTRDLTDYRNINGLTTGAIVLQAQGITSAVMSFTDAANVVHVMTPSQTIQMGMAVLQRTQALHSAGYAIKLQVESAADMVALNAIDIAAGWPE